MDLDMYTCEGCGSTPEDRKRNKPDAPQNVTTCHYCGSDKCCMCDMGDDVECGNCDTGEGHEEA